MKKEKKKNTFFIDKIFCLKNSDRKFKFKLNARSMIELKFHFLSHTCTTSRKLNYRWINANLIGA